MNILPKAAASKQTFVQFLFHNRRNRNLLYWAGAAVIVQFVLYKYLYPFANYIHDDSFDYLEAAYNNSTIVTYPIGYSKFLRLISVFSKPDLALVGLQYLMIQCSAFFFLFTLFYFYKAGRVTQAVLFCFSIFNPLFLHLSNMVSSDALFLALSITWFTLLVWIIYKPSNKIVRWHAIVLFLTFTVRYNALIYPFIALVVFALSSLPLRKKGIGIGLAFFLIAWFVGLTMFQYKKLTGYWQFSPFSGWLWANNAMNAYREVDRANREPVPLQFRALDNKIRIFFDTHPDFGAVNASPVYMWTSRFPLMQYRDSLLKVDVSTSKFKVWASMGPFYSSYGKYIIKKYPMHFLRYFIGANAWKYFAPPVEYLGNYNWGYPTVQESAVKWFGYTNNQVKTRMKSSKVWILKYYPYFVSITNLMLFLMLFSFLLLNGWQYSPTFNKVILLIGTLWITYAGFNILAAPAALRFLAFPTFLSATFSLLLIDWMALLIRHLKLQDHQQKQDNEFSQKAGVV